MLPSPADSGLGGRGGLVPPAADSGLLAAPVAEAFDLSVQARPLLQDAPVRVGGCFARPLPLDRTCSSAARSFFREAVAGLDLPGDLVHDLAALQVKEIERLIDQGVGWIQLDSLSYNQVFDAHFRSQAGVPGLSPEEILAAAVATDAELVRAAKRKDPGITVGMHICRGNNRSAWMAEGSYEPIAERLFSEVGVDRFLLEYDTERAGGFEPLRFIRPGTTVVLGLVSSKVPQLESPDELRRRIDEAAAYVPLEYLALSPQCGFASTSKGNLLTIDEERRKLALVADTAANVWD